MDDRGKFASKFGVIAAVGGSVVGLGNIWRFPYIAGENGGAAFILVYVIVSFLIAVPIMMSEFAIGRKARTNSMKAFSMLSPQKGWGLIGLLGITTSIVILSFYSVIAGWALEFLKESVMNNFHNKGAVEISADLNLFVNSGWRPIFWVLIFMAASSIIVLSGIEKGIERYNKILMPIFVIILIGLVINSFTLSGFKEGFSFLIKPDFSKINGNVVLQALGQSFFSLSLGMGCMITYGSYIKSSENIMKVAATVSVTDVSIAILSGLAIFPAVFSFGISPTSGPELLFITLPNVFQQMTGGYFISIVFFFLVFVAAITSSVSMLEVITAYISEEFHMKRFKATMISTVFIIFMGSLCALSQMDNSPLRIFGSNLFDLFNNASSLYMLPIGGFLTIFFAGWIMQKDAYKSQLTSGGKYGLTIFPLIRFLMKFVAPIVIALLFMNQLGLVKWN